MGHQLRPAHHAVCARLEQEAQNWQGCTHGFWVEVERYCGSKLPAANSGSTCTNHSHPSFHAISLHTLTMPVREHPSPSQAFAAGKHLPCTNK